MSSAPRALLPTTIFSTLAWVLVVYGIAEILGSTGEVAVLTLGLTLGNHESLKLDRLFRNVARQSGTRRKGPEQQWRNNSLMHLSLMHLDLFLLCRIAFPGAYAIASAPR